ncbi:hypothetical protein RIR_jg3622.t1 [Rhizophagus irregularis DAOM 181602=DAOM 197198]|nr:hypothetical protein RIR_jg3622.t1 [Rhizophagus irregularis DAOM 181602=DAOM 197198]
MQIPEWIAIHLKYPSTFHVHCIWHIEQNLHLRLRSKLALVLSKTQYVNIRLKNILLYITQFSLIPDALSKSNIYHKSC